MSARDRVLLLACLLVLPFLGFRDLWAPDEPRYALVAQEMVRDGHWLHPHVNARPYRDKPPLYFWAEALLSLPFGEVNEWTARLPSALCGLFVVFLLFDLGRRLPLPEGDAELAGTAASLTFATCWLGAWMSPRVNLDVPLTATVVGAVWAAWRAQEAARNGKAPWPWALLAGVSTALGVILKGPVVLLPVVGATLALMVHAEFRSERRGSLTLGALVAGLLAFAAVLLAWLVPATTIGGYDVLGILDEHVVDRASKGRHHVQPFWYYLRSLSLDFLPWTLFVVPALWALLKRGARRSAVDWMLLGWVLLPFFVLSVVVEKRNVYALPLLPGLALILGRWFARLPANEPNPRALRVAGWMSGALLAALGLGLIGGAVASDPLGAAEQLAAAPGLRLAAAGIGLAALGGLFIVHAGLFRRRGPAAALWSVALAFGAVEIALFAALPLADPFKSPRAAGAAVAEMTTGAPLAAWPLFRAGYVYYSDRNLAELTELEELEDWLSEQSRPAWVLTFEQYVEEAPLDGSRAPELLWQGGVGHRSAVLLRYSQPSMPTRSTRGPGRSP